MSNATNVVQMPSRSSAHLGKMSDRKWGKDVMEAKKFCIFPSLLLHAQARLKLTPVHLAIIMHLIDFWWDADRKPFPSKATLAERLGLSPRHVQRQMAELEKMGLVVRNERRGRHRGKLSNEYDLTGLTTRLQELALEFRKVDQEAKKKGRD